VGGGTGSVTCPKTHVADISNTMADPMNRTLNPVELPALPGVRQTFTASSPPRRKITLSQLTFAGSQE
jgi:hypothetical protein